MDPGSLPPTARPTGAPSLAELRAVVEAGLAAHPELRQGLGAALAELRRAMGEEVPDRRTRRGSGLR